MLHRYCFTKVGYLLTWFFFFQAEDGIRDLVRSRGLGDVYKRQADARAIQPESYAPAISPKVTRPTLPWGRDLERAQRQACLLYTSDAADERSSVDLGGRRIIKKKKKQIWYDDRQQRE